MRRREREGEREGGIDGLGDYYNKRTHSIARETRRRKSVATSGLGFRVQGLGFRVLGLDPATEACRGVGGCRRRVCRVCRVCRAHKFGV